MIIRNFEVKEPNTGNRLYNKQGKINTWCIFFYATMFLNNGLCLYPTKSLVRNIGHDGSGTHCATSSEYTEQALSNEPVIIEKQPVIENKITFNDSLKHN